MLFSFFQLSTQSISDRETLNRCVLLSIPFIFGSLCCSWPLQGESVWGAFFHPLTKLKPASTAQCTFLHSAIPPLTWFKPRLLIEINSAKFSSTSTFIYTWTVTQTVAPVPSEGDRGCEEILEENYIWYLIDNLHNAPAQCLGDSQRWNKFFAWKV